LVKESKGEDNCVIWESNPGLIETVMATMNFTTKPITLLLVVENNGENRFYDPGAGCEHCRLYLEGLLFHPRWA
jgi:hypothetical protein